MSYDRMKSMRRTGTLFLAFALCLATASAASDREGLPNFYKVDDHVYRGAQPSADGFKKLAQMGVKTIIDLRGPEHSEAEEKRIVEQAGMRYVSIPMKGMQTPTETQVSGALALMNDSQAWPVFIHCRRGADRTGAVVACYRIRHDHWDNAKALREARHNGMSFFQLALQHYVLGYDPATMVAGASPTAAVAPATVNQ
jgi:tyrosine-protein phosphatase SIW14